MITFYKKYWRTFFDIALIVLTVYLIMLTFSYVYKIAAPILLALVIFWIIEPLAKFLNKWGLPKSIASALSILFFTLVIVGAMIGAGAIFANQISAIAGKMMSYSSTLQEQALEKVDELQKQIKSLPPDFTDNAKTYIGSIATKGGKLAKTVLQGIFNTVTSVSAFVFNMIVAVILAYFLSLEIKSWKRITREKTPNTFKHAYKFLKDNVIKGIAGYIKAQLVLISITFIIIFASLLMLQVNNAFSISLLSAFFDVLPLLGVSTVFIPWIIYLFFVGKTTLAIWLSGILIVVLGARQILEPKITGNTLGVSAFTMLSFMIISLSLFGVAGIIMSPILIILIKALYEQGYLKRWIRMPAEDYDQPPLYDSRQD